MGEETRPRARPKKKARQVATSEAKVLCISGPNLQLLGVREPEIYGRTTLGQIHAELKRRGTQLGVTVDTRQTNHEGQIVDWLGAARETFVGVLLNAGAYTHTSLAIYDSLRAIDLPCVEVHLSNPEAREAYRAVSKVAPACVGKVAGFGGASYLLALDGLVAFLSRRS